MSILLKGIIGALYEIHYNFLRKRALLLGVWIEHNKLSVRDDIDMPVPKANEALLRVIKAGICDTDLELVKGYYPFTGIPGHEFVGKVVECVGDPAMVGRRVTATINIACGACQHCRSGRSHHCENRAVLGLKEQQGAFAEFISVPINNIVPVPDEISDEAAVFIEPLAAALRIQQQISITEKDEVLVLGAGKLGQLVAQSLVLTGCRLQVVARHLKQKSLLLSRGISSLEESAIPFGQFDIVIEATGSPQGFSLAQTAVRPEGVIVLKSTYKGTTDLDLSAAVVNEITVIGSRCGPFETAIKMLVQKEVEPAILMDCQYRLKDAFNAFEKANTPGALKILLSP